MHSTQNKGCTHPVTQLFRLPSGRVKELCTVSRCWANVRGEKRFVPVAEAKGREAFPLGVGHREEVRRGD